MDFTFLQHYFFLEKNVLFLAQQCKTLIGKLLVTLFRCCLVAIIIRSVLSGLSFRLVDSIHYNISVRQSLKMETDYCACDCESDM